MWKIDIFPYPVSAVLQLSLFSDGDYWICPICCKPLVIQRGLPFISVVCSRCGQRIEMDYVPILKVLN